MRNISIFLVIAFFSPTLSAQYESMEIRVPRAGSNDEYLLKTITPEITKALTYDSLNMSYAGGWSLGQSFCISSSPDGSIVFAGAGAGVIIFDATDPYNLVKLSEVHARALVDDIHYDPEWQWLYLSAYFSGLEVWDLSDIEYPVRIGRAGTTGLPRGGVYVPPVPDIPGQSPTAYLVNVVDGIDVFSVDWEGQPTFVTNQNFTGSTLIWNSFGTGDTLFLASGSTGTKAVALTFPMTNPFNVPGYSTSVAALDNLIYVVNHSSGMKIYDYSAIPVTLTGEVSLTGFPYRVSLAEGLASVANSTTNPGGGVNIVETADPANPTLVGTYASYQTFITGRSDATFSTGSQDGLVALDITDPADPKFASNYELPVSAIDIAVKNDYAYMGNNGFRVFDVSDKTHPVQVGYHETDGALVKLHGNHAVFCPESMGSSNKVNIMDISDPFNPEKIAHLTAPYMTNDLDLKGSVAYIACWWDGIRVVDFSDPANPVWGSHVMGWTTGATPGEEWLYCQALDVEGDFLFAVDYGPFPDEDTRGLYVFDISEPLNPILLKRLPDYQGTAYDIEVSNGYAYIADSEGGLSIVSVVDPLAPVQTSYLPLGDAAWAVDVFGTYAFVANYINEGVQVIDVTLPAAPFVQGYYKRSGCFALNVTYNAGHVFVADGPAGMQIYNFDLLNNTQPVGGNHFDLQVYPNPAMDRLYIKGMDQVNSASPLEIKIFDLSGRILLHEQIPGFNQPGGAHIDLAGIPAGLLLVEVSGNDFNDCFKVFIQ